MRRLATILLLAVAALTPFTATASADNSYGFSFPGQRDITANPGVAAAAAWGSAWLERHGVHECATKPGGRVMLAPDLTLSDGPAFGRALQCDVWLLDIVVKYANAMDKYDLAEECDVVTHEEAHTGGMSHADMARTGLEERWTNACLDDFAAPRAATYRLAMRQKREREARR